MSNYKRITPEGLAKATERELTIYNEVASQGGSLTNAATVLGINISNVGRAIQRLARRSEAEFVPPTRTAVSRSRSKPLGRVVTSTDVPAGSCQVMIADTQCKPGIDLAYLRRVGQYLVHKKPQLIVMIGDHADMPSLSIYDKGKRKAEGKRVNEDIDAAIDGMNALLQPLLLLQAKELKEHGEVRYKPRLILTLGNHEERIMRHVNANPELHGFLSYDNLKYEEFGWEVYDFLQPVTVNGMTYAHFMANPMTGRPFGGQALNVLKQVGESFCVGHTQKLDIATRFLPASGKQQWGIIAGACYEHDEDYKGIQGNHHWRGIVVKHNVVDGSCDPMFVSLGYLKERYG